MTPENRIFIPLTTDEMNFADRCAQAAYTGAMPMDPEKVKGRPIKVEGYGVIEFADIPFNRGMHAIHDAFPGDVDRAKSAVARILILLPLVEKPPLKKWVRKRPDGVREIYDHLYVALCAVPFSLADVSTNKRLKSMAAKIAIFTKALECAAAEKAGENP